MSNCYSCKINIENLLIINKYEVYEPILKKNINLYLCNDCLRKFNVLKEWLENATLIKTINNYESDKENE